MPCKLRVSLIHSSHPALPAARDSLPLTGFAQDTRNADHRAPPPALEEFRVRGVETQTRQDRASELR